MSTPTRRRVSPEMRAEIIRRINAGEYEAAIGRAVGISRARVSTVARQEGLTIAACPTFGKPKAQPATPATDTLRAHYAGLLHSMRWGQGHGA